MLEQSIFIEALEKEVPDSPSPWAAATIDQPIAEGPGTVIGSYKLMEPIGEGGMGTASAHSYVDGQVLTTGLPRLETCLFRPVPT